MEGTGKPEYGKCVEISTKAAIREMMLPGAITIISPIIIGFVMGPEALGAYMAGVCVSGVLWALFQNNAGGAWDNAKKSFEKGVQIGGQTYYKGSEPHKAAVTGDTVGDPFKDTSGPSMNILIKLTCLVGLVIAPILGGGHHEEETVVAPTAQTEEQTLEVKKVMLTDTLGVTVGIEQKTENNVASVSITEGNVNALSDADLTQLKNDGFDLSKFIDATRWNALKADEVIVAQN
jgi:K(+)-stimulated pyrophosphate-energized sodium pump